MRKFIATSLIMICPFLFSLSIACTGVLPCVTITEVEVNSDGTAKLTASDVYDSASDNCTLASLTISRANPSPNDTSNEVYFICQDFRSFGDCDRDTEAAVDITVTGTDLDGNVRTCDQTITLKDPSPVIIWPANITMDCFDGNNGISPDPSLTGEPRMSSCRRFNHGFFFEDSAPVITPTGAVITRNWTGLDWCTPGLVYSSQQTITLTDDTAAPMLDCPAFIELIDLDNDHIESLSALDLEPIYGVQATDNCSGPITLDINPSDFPRGTTIATVMATDLAGNIGTCPIEVTVKKACSDAPMDLSTTQQENEVTFSWNPVLGADDCTIAIQRLTGGGGASWNHKNVLANFSNGTLPSSEFIVGLAYEWKVKCRCSNGATQWSDKLEFTYQNADGPLFISVLNDPFTSKDRLLYDQARVFPNPVHDLLNISFDREVLVPLKLHLINLDGKVVREQTVGTGALNGTFSVKGVPAGLYILQVQGGEESRQFKVLVN